LLCNLKNSKETDLGVLHHIEEASHHRKLGPIAEQSVLNYGGQSDFGAGFSSYFNFPMSVIILPILHIHKFISSAAFCYFGIIYIHFLLSWPVTSSLKPHFHHFWGSCWSVSTSVTVLCITPTRSSVFDISISHGIAPDGL
jgi:hypothetical protein